MCSVMFMYWCFYAMQDTICCKNLSLTLLMMGKILPETC